MPHMEEPTVSFRCSTKVLETAQKICVENDVTLTTYISTAVLHLIHNKARQGKLETPEFLLKLEENFGRRSARKRWSSEHID